MPCKTISAFLKVCELVGHSSKLGGYSVKQSKSIFDCFFTYIDRIIARFSMKLV